MSDTDHEKIIWAKNILGLEDAATMEEIRSAYRNLTLQYHPDRCEDEFKVKCKEKFQQINNAYEIVTAYCANYRYSFKEKDVTASSPDSGYYERFYDDWF